MAVTVDEMSRKEVLDSLNATFPPDEKPEGYWVKATGQAGGGDAWDWEKDGPVIEGLYMKKSSNVGPNNSNMYDVELPGGEVRSIWGSTVIDRAFNDIPLHSEIRIEYLGKKKNPKTHREFKDYDINYHAAEK